MQKIIINGNYHVLDIVFNKFQVGVLLMDCQGTVDTTHADTALDNLIHYIGLQAATVQMVNVQNRLNTRDITGIQVIYVACN